MNVRQERFAELVATGMPFTRAYVLAGYSDKGKNAEANATRMMGNDGVKERILGLRKESREMARMTKTKKLQLLEALMTRSDTRDSVVIAAIKAHNEMTGDNEPTVSVIKTGIGTLELLEARAEAVVSALDRNITAKP